MNPRNTEPTRPFSWGQASTNRRMALIAFIVGVIGTIATLSYMFCTNQLDTNNGSFSIFVLFGTTTIITGLGLLRSGSN